MANQVEYKVIFVEEVPDAPESLRDIPNLSAEQKDELRKLALDWYNTLGQEGWILCKSTSEFLMFYRSL